MVHLMTIQPAIPLVTFHIPPPTAFEFGLLKAMVGIRQMLSLIWSKEKGIKESVVDAYKRLYIPTEGNER